jgi:hypothetical protein
MAEAAVNLKNRRGKGFVARRQEMDAVHAQIDQLEQALKPHLLRSDLGPRLSAAARIADIRNRLCL